MPGADQAAETAWRRIAAVIPDGGRVAVLLRDQPTWRREGGYTFVPLELPGMGVYGGGSDADALVDLGWLRLSCTLRALPVPWIYAPSERHAIDRRLAEGAAGAPAPLIEIAHTLPAESPGERGLCRVPVRVYRAAPEGTPTPFANAHALLWLTLAELRAAVRGLPLDELLGPAGAPGHGYAGAEPPDDAFVYVSGGYGERYLLRAAGKYGVEALLGEG